MKKDQYLNDIYNFYHLIYLINNRGNVAQENSFCPKKIFIGNKSKVFHQRNQIKGWESHQVGKIKFPEYFIFLIEILYHLQILEKFAWNNYILLRQK